MNYICEHCDNAFTSFQYYFDHTNHRHLRPALAENARLRAALADAAETIHSEFCGSGKHHPLCAGPRTALEEKRDTQT